MWCPRPGFSSCANSFRLGRLGRSALRREAGAEPPPLADIAERHRAEVEVDLAAQLLPQIVRQTSAAVATAADRLAGLAADRLDLLLDREDDVGNAGVVAVMCEQISAARPAHAPDETAAAQLGEKLLEIGQRNLLPPRDLAERDRSRLAVPGKIDHRHNRVAGPGAELHRSLLIPAT